MAFNNVVQMRNERRKDLYVPPHSLALCMNIQLMPMPSLHNSNHNNNRAHNAMLKDSMKIC